MSVEQSTERDRGAASPSGGGDAARRSGGSHRAPRTSRGLLVPVVGVALVVVAVVVGFLVLGGSEDPSEASGATSGAAAGTTDGTDAAAAGDGTGGDGGDGGDAQGSGDPAAPGETALATQQASVAAGQSLARNPGLELDPAERTELEEGRVDIRVLSLLALLGADFDLGVADFAAPDNPDGLRTAYVVDLDSVDGEPVTAVPAQELARVAADQLGVYQPQDVSLEGSVLRITFEPRDSEDLPPVPLP